MQPSWPLYRSQGTLTTGLSLCQSSLYHIALQYTTVYSYCASPEVHLLMCTVKSSLSWLLVVVLCTKWGLEAIYSDPPPHISTLFSPSCIFSSSYIPSLFSVIYISLSFPTFPLLSILVLNVHPRHTQYSRFAICLDFFLSSKMHSRCFMCQDLRPLNCSCQNNHKYVTK